MANSAGDFVNSGFNQSADYAADAWNLIQQYVNEILSKSSTYTSLIIPKDFVYDPNYEYTPLPATMPTPPTFPSVPVIEDNFVMPDFPGKPEVSFPNSPVLTDHVIPEYVNDMTVPEFSETLPEIDLTPIEEANVMALFGRLTADYAPQISSIKDILLDRIINGGTGLPANIETAIWKRNLERDEQALQDAVDATASQWAKMNFALPDGMLSNAIATINNEYVDGRLIASREISIEQAKMEQTNINESLKLVAAIEEAFNNVMVQYVNVCANAMKTAADVAVQIYNTTVQYYNLLIDSYRAKADVYGIRVKAQLTDVEIYRALIDGVGKAIAADESKVRIYTAQIGAEEAKLNAYKTEMAGIATQIDALRSWLEVGKTRMELFATEINALNGRYTSEMEGFKSEVFAWSSGNTAKTAYKDISLRQQIQVMDSRVREADILFKNIQEKKKLDVQKMIALAEVGSHVVAGALAAAHASASLSQSEVTSIDG